MPNTQTVSIVFLIGVGSRYESDGEAGISHFIEHLLFKGTDKRPSAREISEAIEGVGGILNGGTDRELTIYWVKVARPHFEQALDVLTDMLTGSRLDAREIDRERQVIVEEINMSYDDPSHRVGLLVDEILWPGHPLGRDIAGTKQSVSTISRPAMRRFIDDRYLPGNTVVSIAGNIEHGEAAAAVAKACRGWAGRQKPPGYRAFRQRKSFPRVAIESREIEQVHLFLALPGLSLQHPGRFALSLLNVILGEGMSSRLFSQIRDRMGLAYSIYSFTEHFRDCGSLAVYAGVEPGNLRVAVKAILEQLSGLRETISPAELTKAKEFSKGRLLLRMEDSRSVAGWIGAQEALSGRVYSVDEVVAIIDAITAAELKKLAGELMVASRLRLALVGPVAAAEPLEELLSFVK
jgi:predicted Zn-dependent peptidase